MADLDSFGMTLCWWAAVRCKPILQVQRVRRGPTLDRTLFYQTPACVNVPLRQSAGEMSYSVSVFFFYYLSLAQHRFTFIITFDFICH